MTTSFEDEAICVDGLRAFASRARSRVCVHAPREDSADLTLRFQTLHHTKIGITWSSDTAKVESSPISNRAPVYTPIPYICIEIINFNIIANIYRNRPRLNISESTQIKHIRITNIIYYLPRRFRMLFVRLLISSRHDIRIVERILAVITKHLVIKR